MSTNIILILLLIIMFILTINSLFLEKIEKNYVFIFNIWWIFWLIISYLNIGEFYPRALKTYIYIYSGLIMLNLSMYYIPNAKKKLDKELNNMKLKILISIEIIFLLINVYYLVRMMYLAKSFANYWMVRFIFFGIEFGGITSKLFLNSLEVHIYNLLRCLSLTSFLIGLSLLEKKQKKLFFLSLINVSLYCLLSGGRDFISYLIIIGIFSFKAKKIKKNLKIISVLILSTLLMTFLREASIKKVFMSIVTYYSGAIAYFDNLLKHENYKFYNGELLFSGIIAPLKFILRYIGLEISGSGLSEVGVELMKFVQLSDTNSFFKLYNALATSFYWQYKDFGYAGIVIINFLLGIFYRVFYKKLDENNLNHIIIMSYLEYLLIQTIFSFKYIDLFSVLPLIIYIYMLKRSKKCYHQF